VGGEASSTAKAGVALYRSLHRERGHLRKSRQDRQAEWEANANGRRHLPICIAFVKEGSTNCPRVAASEMEWRGRRGV
jgi:hypothetical protein